MYIEEFEKYLLSEKRFSNHTKIAYLTDLEQFFLFCKQNNLQIQEVTYQFLRIWLVNLIENNLAPTSVNRKISSIKTYFKFLIRNNLIKLNPAIKLSLIKKKKTLPNFVEKENMDNLLDEIEFENNFKGIRDKLILSMFYFTGMRRSELINITINDIDYYKKTIKVLGKRNKERLIPITDNFIKEINNYIEYRDQQNNIQNNFLFITEKGKQIYSKAVYRIVNNYLNKITKIDKKSPHVLRHTFATHMLNNGADLNAIKEILGHANLSATQIYTHNTFEKIKKIYKQAHPRA
jgi:integrase/recombinase XerC